jgi:hypothetical protein
MTKFSANEPALGYHYQIRYGLYLLLEASSKDDAYIRFEKLDDVEVGELSKINLYQTKLHVKKAADLSDKSPDLWKTLRVWSELILTNEIDLNNALLFLVTSAEILEGSIIKELADENNKSRNIINIVKKLEESAATSKNKSLKSSFESFNKLTMRQKEKLVENIFVYDKSLSIEKIEEEIKHKLKLFLLPNQIDKAYEYLEGWWYGQCIDNLRETKDKIAFYELNNKIRDINVQFADDNLPIDDLIRDAIVNTNDYDQRIFVKQLQLVNVGQSSIGRAVSNFYRASEQRSKWIRLELLNPEEEISFEKKLVDDWENKFAQLKDEAEVLNEELCTKRGNDFYAAYYVNSYPPHSIRPRVTEAFIILGSCQMLSDKKKIGWHPKFKKLIK